MLKKIKDIGILCLSFGTTGVSLASVQSCSDHTYIRVFNTVLARTVEY